MKKLILLFTICILAFSCTTVEVETESSNPPVVENTQQAEKDGDVSLPFSSYETYLVWAQTVSVYTGPERQNLINLVKELQSGYVSSETSKVKCKATHYMHSFTHDLYIVKCSDGTKYLVATHNGEVGDIRQI